MSSIFKHPWESVKVLILVALGAWMLVAGARGWANYGNPAFEDLKYVSGKVLRINCLNSNRGFYGSVHFYLESDPDLGVVVYYGGPCERYANYEAGSGHVEYWYEAFHKGRPFQLLFNGNLLVKYEDEAPQIFRSSVHAIIGLISLGSLSLVIASIQFGWLKRWKANK